VYIGEKVMSSTVSDTFAQERALICSVALTKDQANELGGKLGTGQDIDEFVPGMWGKDALNILGDDSKKEALSALHHLDPQIDRSKPVTVTNVHNVWGPIADPSGNDKYYVVLVTDIMCSRTSAVA
jgi:hypothetical protein